MKPTSIAAYDSLKGSKSLRKQIYLCIYANPGCTRNDISRHTRLPINSVTGRVRELMIDGVIYEEGTTKDVMTGRHGARLYVKPRGKHERRAA